MWQHGIGKLQLPNGDKYQGSFSADRFEGEGSYFFANGDVYSGAWKAGERSGEGRRGLHAALTHRPRRACACRRPAR